MCNSFDTMNLSVVVITRNAEEFMYDCLDSLVNQSVKPLKNYLKKTRKKKRKSNQSPMQQYN